MHLNEINVIMTSAIEFEQGRLEAVRLGMLGVLSHRGAGLCPTPGKE